MIQVFARSIAIAATVFLASCGGGGGGEPTRSVRFNTATLEATAFQNQQQGVNAFEGASVEVEATISDAINDNVYISVQDSGQGFQGSSLSVLQLTGTSFQATLQPNVNLEPGVYTGQLTLLLCKDAACNEKYPLTGQTLPYAVTITPQLYVDVYVNGALIGSIKSGDADLPAAAPDGSLVELKSSIPMEVRYSIGASGLAQVTVDPSSDETDWKGVLTSEDGNPAWLKLIVVAQDSSFGVQQSANVEVEVPVDGGGM